VLGDTIQQHWQRMKMQWARTLLRTPDMSVADVAYRVGYEDPFYFSRAFKRVVGVSPARWRKQA